MNGLHHFFTPLDWAVVVGYFLLATLVGFLMRGKQASIKDFFLGGRSLPWPAVTGAIIATEISGLTFIVVPAMVVALQGDFTYLQWAIGSISGRILVGLFFVKVFYENDVYSPYDFMGSRLGRGVKTFATVLFTVGNILAQSARVLFVALLLKGCHSPSLRMVHCGDLLLCNGLDAHGRHANRHLDRCDARCYLRDRGISGAALDGGQV